MSSSRGADGGGSAETARELAAAERLRPIVPLVQNASVVATRLIREAIIDGRFAPGRRLKEEEIARDLGISRTPVREALLVLQSEGLVDAAPNRGAIVRERSAVELDESYQLRALLEAYAANRAAARMTETDVRALAASCDRFESLCEGNFGNTRDLAEENLTFHSIIIKAADSPLLESTLRRITDAPLIYKLYVWYSPEQRRIALHYHRQILKAMRAQDVERAGLVMREHLLEARDHVLLNIKQGPRA